MGGLEWWHWVIIVAAFMLLFGGYKKLPSATKSIAQSMKIFKDETKGLVHGDHDEPAEVAAAPATQHPAHEHAGAIAAPGIVAPVPVPVVSVPPVTVAAPAPAPAPNLVKDPAAVAAAVVPVPAEQPVVVAPPADSLAPRPGAYAGGSQQPR